MWRRAFLIGLMSAVILWISRVEIPLPYPAHHFIFKDFDPALLPTNPMPLEGPYAPNEILRKGHRLFDGVIQSSEHVAISPEGNLTLIDKFGYVYEAAPATSVPGAVYPEEWAPDLPPVAYIGPAGRPLGFHHDGAGNLIIADALKGLLKLERGTRRLELLTSRVSPDAAVAPGSPINYVNALDIAEDGTIYFSSSQARLGTHNPRIYVSVVPMYPGTLCDVPVGLSLLKPAFYDTFRSYLLGLYGGSISGRLLKYDPSTRRTEQLVSGLWFANGVALSADESFVVVVETTRVRVHRHWLKGPRAGTTEVLIDRLPGFPDGIARASDGNFWVALVAPVTSVPKLLRFKLARVLLANLPTWIKPPVSRWGAVLKISPDGKPLQLLMDPDGSKIGFISAVTEHDGKLFFGNVKEDYVSYFDLRDASPLKQQ
ncbi:strictosidine synthase [Volvox carteri f. nagariensis]|uniref:Strictosidine synthase n=1 Tax=Volvox carteri f. nagariensis TaxID=3068 RepID=D8UCI6_VOLCA|nr:strictosidine synthase [Volvox carteri f. nagariensis]EFJ42499.1 strictosidine synthase [Volvox carteri f. nagariensis]|eukprot:XP_002956355.1 strictosidine synthase [Volvox carteri f. nagariensis]